MGPGDVIVLPPRALAQYEDLALGRVDSMGIRDDTGVLHVTVVLELVVEAGMVVVLEKARKPEPKPAVEPA